MSDNELTLVPLTPGGHRSHQSAHIRILWHLAYKRIIRP
jgi:hypothetical protein